MACVRERERQREKERERLTSVMPRPSNALFSTFKKHTGKFNGNGIEVASAHSMMSWGKIASSTEPLTSYFVSLRSARTIAISCTAPSRTLDGSIRDGQPRGQLGVQSSNERIERVERVERSINGGISGTHMGQTTTNAVEIENARCKKAIERTRFHVQDAYRKVQWKRN